MKKKYKPLVIDIEDKDIQELVAKINNKIRNDLYEEVREFTCDYFLLGMYINDYYYKQSSTSMLEFIDKFPRYNGDTFKWSLEGYEKEEVKREE